MRNTYNEYWVNLIEKTGARNAVEAQMIKRIQEHWPHRHRVTTTTSGNSMKVDAYWIRRTIKELRSYRRFLDWCEATSSQIQRTKESFSEPVQMQFF